MTRLPKPQSPPRRTPRAAQADAHGRTAALSGPDTSVSDGIVTATLASGDAAPKRNPRSCVGCSGEAMPDALLRFVLDNGTLVLVGRSNSGTTGRGHGAGLGRGASVHATAGCLRRAAHGGFARAFKFPLALDIRRFAEDLLAALVDRGRGLLVTALRIRGVAIGADAALAALGPQFAGEDDYGGKLTTTSAVQLVIALDAASIVDDTRIQAAIGRGRALAMFTKEELGSILGRDQVAIAAITEARIAGELRRLQGEIAAVRALLAEPSVITAKPGGSRTKSPQRGGPAIGTTGNTPGADVGGGKHGTAAVAHAGKQLALSCNITNSNVSNAVIAAPRNLRDGRMSRRPQLGLWDGAHRHACRIPEVR